MQRLHAKLATTGLTLKRKKETMCPYSVYIYDHMDRSSRHDTGTTRHEVSCQVVLQAERGAQHERNGNFSGRVGRTVRWQPSVPTMPVPARHTGGEEEDVVVFEEEEVAPKEGRRGRRRLHPYRRAMDPAGDAASPWLRHLHALEGDRGRAAAAAWEAREKRGGGGGGGGGTEKEGRWRQGRVWEREVGRTSDICHRLGPVGPDRPWAVPAHYATTTREGS